MLGQVVPLTSFQSNFLSDLDFLTPEIYLKQIQLDKNYRGVENRLRQSKGLKLCTHECGRFCRGAGEKGSRGEGAGEQGRGNSSPRRFTK